MAQCSRCIHWYNRLYTLSPRSKHLCSVCTKLNPNSAADGLHWTCIAVPHACVHDCTHIVKSIQMMNIPTAREMKSMHTKSMFISNLSKDQHSEGLISQSSKCISLESGLGEASFHRDVRPSRYWILRNKRHRCLVCDYRLAAEVTRVTKASLATPPRFRSLNPLRSPGGQAGSSPRPLTPRPATTPPCSVDEYKSVALFCLRPGEEARRRCEACLQFSLPL
jgi:hypothetical protein